MDNNLTENETKNADSSTIKESKKRLTYVSKDHKSMVDFVNTIYINLGHTDYHSNKAIATAHGLSPDSIKSHLSSAQQYKLLELKHGIGYKITESFKSICMPFNEGQKRTAIIESLKAPETYQQLFKEYEFHVLPPLNGLKNYFVRTYGFKSDVAEKTSQIFIDNLKDYELLDTRGVVTTGMPYRPNVQEKAEGQPAATPEKVIEKNIGQHNYVQQQQNSNNDDDYFELTIPLPNKRKAFLKYPSNDLSTRDISVITKALELIGITIETNT